MECITILSVGQSGQQVFQPLIHHLFHDLNTHLVLLTSINWHCFCPQCVLVFSLFYVNWNVAILSAQVFMYERIMHCIHLFLLKRGVSRCDNVMYNIFIRWCFPVLSGFISVGPGGLKRKGGSVQGRGASLHSNLYRVARVNTTLPYIACYAPECNK